LKKLFRSFQSPEKKPLAVDPSEITTDQERRKVFLRYVNRAWLIFGIVTLATLPIFPEQRGEFVFLIALIFPTYLITRLLNASGRTRFAGVVFTLSVNFGFYGLFLVLVQELGASRAFETQTTVWLLMGLAVLFAGAFVDKWAAPMIAGVNSILLIGTRLTIAPGSDPRPSALVFWWMIALTTWLYEGTLHEALRRTRAEVTERQQTDKAIQEAELKYRMLVERLPVAVYTSEFGVNNRWHYISPQVKQLLGFTVEELLTDPTLWYRRVHPDDRSRQKELEEQAWASQESLEGEYRMFTRDGRLIWIRDSAHILISQDNDTPIVQGVLMDITERKQAEEALSLSQAQLLANLNNTPNVAVQWYDKDGRILYWNPASETMYGWNSVDAIGKTLEQLIHTPEEQAEFIRILAEVQETGNPFGPYEARIRRRDGTAGWILATTFIIPMYDEQVGFVCMDVDITERKQAEEELRQSETRYRNLFNTMEEGVAINEVVFDESGNAIDYVILDVNPAFERQSPYKLQDAVGKRATQLYGMSPEFIRDWWQQHQHKKQAAQIEYYHEPSGRWFFITTTVPEQGRFATIFLNITERKQAELVQGALYEIANVAQTADSLNDLFASIHKALRRFMPAENFYIAIYDIENDLLSFPYFVDQYDRQPLPQKPNNGLTGYILRTRQPLLATPEVRENLLNNQLATSIGASSANWIGVPLNVGDETFGVMAVQTYTEKLSLGQKDLEFLTFVSTQVAMVIKRKQAEEAVRQRTSQLEVLRQIGLELTAELDVDKLLHSITAHALDLLHSTGGGIYLCRPEQKKLEWVVAIGTEVTPLGTMLDHGEGLSGKVWKQLKPILVDDYEHWEGRAAQYDGKPFKAVMGVPIIKGDEFLGVLVVLADRPGSFNMQAASLLELFAGYAAVAIHNARLYQSARQRLFELEVLYETSNTLSTEHELNTLLRSIVENARKLLNTATSGMYLTIADSDELELAMDTAPYIPLGSRIKSGEGVAGRVAQTRQPVRIDDYSTWEGRSSLYEGAPIRAVLEVPMLYQGQLIGILTADETGETERRFTEADEQLLALFASQAAGVIHSARLLDQTRRRAEEFTALYETTHDLAVQQDLSTVMNIITKRASALLSVPNATIILYHPKSDNLEIAASIGPDLAIGTRRKLGDGLAGRVAQTRLPLIVDDYQRWEHRSPLYDAIAYTAMMGVPLLYGGSLLGVLDVSDIAPSKRVFNDADMRLLSLFAGQAASAIANAQLFEDLKKSNNDIMSAYDTTIEGWSRAMDLRDHETEGHTLRVTDLTLKLARRMGLSESELIHIRRGSLLHDIGKMGVPDAILLKEGTLSEEEWVMMRKHPQFAFEMLSSIDYLHEALDIPSNHHEKWDGTGYPRGLTGEQIPLAARVFAVVDVWDAIRSDRPYRRGWNAERAIDYIKAQSGTHFDPKVVAAFLSLLPVQ
jgi:PAS domain S-box-containing protein/putative nucleotidyltransferase with HDIG domain